MKHYILVSVMAVATLSTKAQLQVSTQHLDLESINKHKNWKIIDAGIDSASQKTFVKFATASCDIDKSTIGNMTTTTFKGLAWKVDKLLFDDKFNYVSNDLKTYSNTFEAINNNEQVYGQKYNAILAGGIGGALSGAATPTGPIDNAYMGTVIVTGFANLSGFKIGTSRIGIQVGGESGKWRPDACFENAAVFKIDNVPAKEEKGQRWIPMFNHPIPNGGHILFNTSGVNPDETKQHYIFRKYDQSGSIAKHVAFTFDYQCLMYAKEIEMTPGKFDYVFVSLPINYKRSTAKLAPANQYEYIRIDGTTFDIKHKITITAPHSLWKINQVYEQDGAVYLCGDAGKDATTYQDFSVPKASDYPNFQIAKIENGKLVYVTLVKEADIQAKFQPVNEEKVKAEMSLQIMDVQLHVANGKLIFSGQQSDNGARGDAIIAAIFATDGQLEKVLAKGTTFSKGNFVFTKDFKKCYWLIQDVTEYNKWDRKSGIITAKASKQLLTALSIVTYDLNNQSLQYQSLMNDDWGIQYNNTLLYNTNNEVVLLGGKLTKKAKESELVFISIKK
jgi:hypothetical protein